VGNAPKKILAKKFCEKEKRKIKVERELKEKLLEKFEILVLLGGAFLKDGFFLVVLVLSF
jgi:thioredoxin-related protein